MLIKSLTIFILQQRTDDDDDNESEKKTKIMCGGSCERMFQSLAVVVHVVSRDATSTKMQSSLIAALEHA